MSLIEKFRKKEKKKSDYQSHFSSLSLRSSNSNMFHVKISHLCIFISFIFGSLAKADKRPSAFLNLQMNCVSVSSFSFLWLLLCLFMPSHCVENDAPCLISIKHSINPCEDRSFWYSFGIGYVCSATSVIVSFMYYCQPWTELKKGRRNGTSAFKRKKQNYLNGSRNVAELLPLALEEKGSKEISILLERLISRMKFGELCEATNYFSTDSVIGLGSTGMMYKAKLPNNCLLAVKRLYHSEQNKTEFLLETMIPGRHKHRNIVPLLGFCLVKRERILVYKYMSNGKLPDWLHRPMMLEWPVRVHIALGLARGLSWLHKKCKIVHLNLTSDCVLLNKDFEPKISNFDRARFIDQTIDDHLRMKLFRINALGVKGSIEKDVYSFGIILFELITGKRLSPTITDSSDIDDSLMRFISANTSSGPSDFYNAIDQCLVGKGFDDKILCLIEVACDCVNPSLVKRPSMDDTYKKIRALWEGFELKSDSGKRKLSMVCPVQITCTHEIECIL